MTNCVLLCADMNMVGIFSEEIRVGEQSSSIFLTKSITILKECISLDNCSHHWEMTGDNNTPTGAIGQEVFSCQNTKKIG